MDDAVVELLADPGRRLPHTDPRGRSLAISCGAALHHAQVAARGLGYRPAVQRWPDGPESDLLARVSLSPAARSADDVALLRALRERRTDRRRFTSWPVQGARLERLVEVARESRGDAIALHDVIDRFRLEHLVGRARLAQAADPALLEEHRRWTDHGPYDGVPAVVVPPATDEVPSRRTRFPDGSLEDRDHEIETTDGVVVLCGAADDRASWVATGEALGAVWLHAVQDGLAIVPLSQVVEVDETRSSLQHQVLLGVAAPHLVLRVGWQAISRRHLPRTPRRPVTDVLVP